MRPAHSRRVKSAQLLITRNSARLTYRVHWDERLVSVGLFTLGVPRRHLLSVPASRDAHETHLRKAPRRWHRLPTPWRTVHQAGTAGNLTSGVRSRNFQRDWNQGSSIYFETLSQCQFLYRDDISPYGKKKSWIIPTERVEGEFNK